MRTRFDIWVDRMIEEYSTGSRYLFFYRFGITLCYDTRKNKVGIARKHPEDKCNEQIGRAIAYARCKGYEIPKQEVYKKLNEMKRGDIFFSLYGTKYVYICKFQGLQNNTVFVAQNVITKTCSILTNGETEYEMVE